MTSPYSHGEFCWHEIGTRDLPAARRFYTELLDWTAEDMPMPEGFTYVMLRSAMGDVAGLYPMDGPNFEGVPPHWMPYVWVDDVKEIAAKADALGGAVMSPPMDMPGIGTMATLRDPAGAVVSVFNGDGGHQGAARGEAGAMVGWNELTTTDLQGAKGFYGGLFGWGSREDTSTGNPYTMFQRGDQTVAGAMAMEGEMWAGVPPHWMPYVSVQDADATAARATELGGKVCIAPTDIPNVGRFAILEDPSGATFSIIKFLPMPQ